MKEKCIQRNTIEHEREILFNVLVLALESSPETEKKKEKKAEFYELLAAHKLLEFKRETRRAYNA